MCRRFGSVRCKSSIEYAAIDCIRIQPAHSTYDQYIKHSTRYSRGCICSRERGAGDIVAMYLSIHWGHSRWSVKYRQETSCQTTACLVPLNGFCDRWVVDVDRRNTSVITYLWRYSIDCRTTSTIDLYTVFHQSLVVNHWFTCRIDEGRSMGFLFRGYSDTHVRVLTQPTVL